VCDGKFQPTNHLAAEQVHAFRLVCRGFLTMTHTILKRTPAVRVGWPSPQSTTSLDLVNSLQFVFLRVFPAHLLARDFSNYCSYFEQD